jgi:hypothetical protein
VSADCNELTRTVAAKNSDLVHREPDIPLAAERHTVADGLEIEHDTRKRAAVAQG